MGPAHESITFAVSSRQDAAHIGKDTNVAVRMRKGSVIRAQRPNGSAVRHPTEKPVALLTELVESSSRIGDVVLDPFAGTGSTGVAAILRGRQAFLIEIDEDSAQLVAERIQRAEAVALDMRTV